MWVAHIVATLAERRQAALSPHERVLLLMVACPPAADHVRCRQQPRYPLVHCQLHRAAAAVQNTRMTGPPLPPFLVESIGVKAIWLAGPGPGPGPEAEPRPGPGAQREATFSHPMPNAVERMCEWIPPSAVPAISGCRVSNTPRRGASHDDSAAGSPSLRPDEWSA